MKQTIIYSSLVGWFILFCLATNLFESIAMFLLFGIVPWSSTALSAQSMLLFYFVIAAAMLFIGVKHQFKSAFKNLRLSTQSHSQA